MNEVIAALEDDPDFFSANIYIQPLQNSTGIDTDEDSGSEESGGSMDNLTGRQLRAEACATIFSSDNQKTVIGEADTDTSDSETTEAPVEQSDTRTKTTGEQDSRCSADLINLIDGTTNNSVDQQKRTGKRRGLANVDTKNAKWKNSVGSALDGAYTGNVPVSVFQQNKRLKRSRSAPASRVWRKADMKHDDDRRPVLTKPSFLAQDLTPSCLFEYFFDDEIVNLIVDMSRRYAHQKLKPNFDITADSLRAFLAVLLLSGYVPLPRRRMYWEQASDVRNEAVTGAMSLNRFEEILRYLHVADNAQLDSSDKMAKIRPLFNHLNDRYVKYWPVEEDLDVDESMVPYYDRHSSKQFIRGKPIRFGFKIWCLNTRLGYLIQFEPYQGASSTYDSNLGNNNSSS